MYRINDCQINYVKWVDKRPRRRHIAQRPENRSLRKVERLDLSIRILSAEMKKLNKTMQIMNKNSENTLKS